MGIRVTYPNSGVYAGGKARWERYDDKTGEIQHARYATDEEAMRWAQIEATHRLADLTQQLSEQLHNLLTYGVRHT